MSTVLVKPVGDRCNLACRYCFYHPGTGRCATAMEKPVLEAMTRAFLAEESSPCLFAWQGGEPTLAGIDFYRLALDVQRRFAAPQQRVVNTLQTNGVLIDDEWAAFLAQNRFLVGLSLDGPAEYHDQMRRGADGSPSHGLAAAAWRRLRRCECAVNILCVVSRANCDHPSEVYSYLTGELGAQYLQFIPCVERTPLGSVADFSLQPGEYGRFLVALFDLWSAETQRAISVKLFDDIALFLAGKPMRDCMHRGACDSHLVVERDGSVYPCDFFVGEQYRLGNMVQENPSQLRATARATAFRSRKSRQLPEQCGACPHLDICRGGCCKFWTEAADGTVQQYLCRDMRYFLDRRRPQMERIGAALRARWHQDTPT